MKNFTRTVSAAALAAAVLLPAAVQAQNGDAMQHFRPYDQRGLHMFETPKEPGAAFDGFEIFWGASFAQQFQALSHSNAAGPDEPQNQLLEIGKGFNLATANLYLGAQLADGIRVHLTTYLSSRGHPEAWVKDGYILIDRSPLEIEPLERLMDYVTLRLGHFEINYGDAHFRRSDNGMAMHNPFVGNLVMDAFTTEIGGEAYFRTPGGFIAMAGITDGEIQGRVDVPDARSPSFYGKLGIDRALDEGLRVRLTGSAYTTSKSASNTLYFGDRAGARYYAVMVNGDANSRSPARTGRVDPGLRDRVTSLILNPFVKAGGLELFATVERAEGRSANETENRTWDQYAGEAVYRFFDENVYLGARYNTVSGELQGSGAEVSVDRFQLAGGWFITPQLLLKAEYVTQKYNDFPVGNILHGGKFDGFMIEGVVSF
jgi:hypothetical protein